MKRQLTAITTALAAVFMMSAFEYQHFVVLNFTDQSSVEYMFEDRPVATFEGSDMKLSNVTPDPNGILYPMAEIENITFRKQRDDSGVDAPKGLCGSFAVNRDFLKGFGLAKGTAIEIFSPEGKSLAHAEADQDGNCSISLTGIPSGVYVVSAGTKSFKFIR